MTDWTTANLLAPNRLIDRVLGQDEALAVIRLAAQQRRFVLLLGEPGTGKSMLGRSLADLLAENPKDSHRSVVISPNLTNPIQPIISQMTVREFEQAYQQTRAHIRKELFARRYWSVTLGALVLFTALWISLRDKQFGYLLAALLGLLFLWNFKLPKNPKASQMEEAARLPKLLIKRDSEKAPFIDATGLSEGALFGDVRHDPYQSGGVETPPHLLVEPGAIHKAHGGVLYIDEISTLSTESQRLLLTAIQEKELPITGRHQGSSGTLIATAPVACDFILVAAGNREDVAHLLPAFRSRILGYGYEVHTKCLLPDHADTRKLVGQFIAQEVVSDGRIPHFDQSGVEAVYQAARGQSSLDAWISTRWREIGGLVRSAGDLAAIQNSPVVSGCHVEKAITIRKTVVTEGSS